MSQTPLAPQSRFSLKQKAALLYLKQKLAPTLQKARTASQFEFRGNALRLQAARDREVVLTGSTRTGKSLACLYKLHNSALNYKGFRGMIIRKTRESLNESGLLTFERDVLGANSTLHSGSRRASRQSYIYPNGSEIVVGGLVANGKEQVAKIMSTEYDMIFVQECTEIAEEEWQQLITRLSNYRMPYQQIIGDCNPNAPTHWVKRRSMSPGTTPGTQKLNLWEVYFQDNPRWWVADELEEGGGHWTNEGQALMVNLSTLTGVSRQRLVEAKWVQAEGLVYNEVWSDTLETNLSELAVYEPGAGEVYWASDDGYSAGRNTQTGGRDPETGFYGADAHPRVILICQMKGDGHLDVLHESYACLKLTDQHIAEALALPMEYDEVLNHLSTLCDRGVEPFGPTWLDEHPNPVDQVRSLRAVPYNLYNPSCQFYDEPVFVSYGPGAAEYRGRLQAAMMIPFQCTERVETSIQEMRSWLAADNNGWRRVRVHPRCVNFRAEMSSYAYEETTGKPRKAYDNGPDALRGLIWDLRGYYEQ